MHKIVLWINVCANGWTAKMSTIASNKIPFGSQCEQLSFSELDSLESTESVAFVEDYFYNFLFQN